MLFDGDGKRMTPTHAVKNSARYRYYVSRPLITKDRTEHPAALRIPAGEIEQLVTSRMRQWLVDPGSTYQATRLLDASAQRQLIARAAEVGKSWPELPGPRQHALLASLIERIDVGVDHIEIHFWPSRIGLLLDVAAPPLGAPEDEPQILSVRVRLRRSGREIRMLIDGADPFATVKPDRRLIKLLIRVRRFNTTPVGGDGVPFAALAKREGVRPVLFHAARPRQLSPPDIIQAIPRRPSAAI